MSILLYLLPILVLAWVIWGIRDYEKLKMALKKGNRKALLREYRVTVIGELVGGAIALGAIGLSIFKPLDVFGINLGGNASSLLIGGAVGFLASLFIFPVLARKGKKVVVGDIEALLPQSKQERLWYLLVALSAGLCEELIFRGYALRALHSLGLAGAGLLIISALVFGLVHIYQGFIGVLVTALMGLFFAVIYVQTGSLWWAILAHALIDLRILLLPTSKRRTS